MPWAIFLNLKHYHAANFFIERLPEYNERCTEDFDFRVVAYSLYPLPQDKSIGEKIIDWKKHKQRISAARISKTLFTNVLIDELDLEFELIEEPRNLFDCV